MKREIKFRLWDKSQNRMVPHNDIMFDYIFDNIDLSGESFELLQFTGLKDKNGVEIYEGDIIQFKYYFVNKRWWSSISDIPAIEKECEKQRNNVALHKATVRFDKGCFVLDYPLTLKDVANGERYKERSSTSCNIEEKQWDFEVIGNIYENPELIN